MGGQQGDKGIIRTAAGEFQVEDTIKLTWLVRSDMSAKMIYRYDENRR
ncbi:MAG: hypothetical protein ACLRP8_12420 [Roseburia intestinalis]